MRLIKGEARGEEVPLGYQKGSQDHSDATLPIEGLH